MKCSQKLSETPEQLARRVDRLYLTLASLYQQIGRVLGLRPLRDMSPHLGNDAGARGDRRRT